MGVIKKRVGVLASGRGSNFRAIAERIAREPDFPAEIVCLVCNVPDAGAIGIAREFNIETKIIEHTAFGKRREFDAAVRDYLKEKGVEIVVLAGFMRILSDILISAFPRKIINIHPALLPSFQGLDAQKRAFDYGCQITGCSVHIVDEGTDTGPIIMQAAIALLPDDTAESLASRILEQEHKIFSEALKIICEERYRWEGRRFIALDYEPADTVLITPVRK
ncbi:MAG: phosphoribosylglycinamide formyltransferase [Myxococcota bacterium]